MAREIRERRKFDFARRVVVVHVEDEFGTITPHTIPLTGDACPHCGSVLPGAQGSRNVAASAAAAVARIDKITDDTLPVLEDAAKDDPEALKKILEVKQKRAKAKADSSASLGMASGQSNATSSNAS